MNCCQCQGIETLFGQKEATRKLEAYRKDGPTGTTRMLIDALKAEGTEGLTLLDIGGGVGAIQHELLRSGLAKATDVDASTAYVAAAREEAERQGHADRVSYHHGNFITLAPQVPSADIVALDRVICCYHDMQALVGLSVAKADKLYALVYPRDTWWMRLAVSIANLYFLVSRNPFRTFAHRTQNVEAIVYGNGFRRRFYKTSGPWQVVVYAR